MLSSRQVPRMCHLVLFCQVYPFLLPATVLRLSCWWRRTLCAGYPHGEGEGKRRWCGFRHSTGHRHGCVELWQWHRCLHVEGGICSTAVTGRDMLAQHISIGLWFQMAIQRGWRKIHPASKVLMLRSFAKKLQQLHWSLPMWPALCVK